MEDYSLYGFGENVTSTPYHSTILLKRYAGGSHGNLNICHKDVKRKRPRTDISTQ